MSPTRDEARELLETLVATPSPSGDESDAARVLVEHLDGWGLDASTDAVGNVRARRPDAPAEAPRLLLMGHLDTVPGQLPVAWEGDTLAGRGAVDAKGPLVAHALALAGLPADLPARVELVAAVGEEAASRGARHLADTREPPHALVIAEPTGLDALGLGYKGRLHGRLSAHAAPTHPGHPDPSAAERLLEAIEALTAWTGNRERDPGTEETTLRVVDLGSDGGPDGQTATAGIDLRVPGRVPEPSALADRLPDGVSLRVDERVPAVRGERRGPLATSLRASLIERGHEPRAVVKTGTSDWNVVAPAWGDPDAVAYGPGDPSLDHTPDEAIALDEVLEAGAVLERAITVWAQRAVTRSGAP